MEPLVITAFAAFLTATPALIAAQSGSSNSAEQQVRSLSREEVEAFLRKDAAAMSRIWSDGLVVTNPLNRFVTGKQVLDMMNSGFLVIRSFERNIEYLREYGDTIIVAGSETVVWGGKMPNAGKTEHLRFTAVWMNQQGRWQEVARHANIVPPQQP